MGSQSGEQMVEFVGRAKPLKPSSSFSDVVSKFAKVCKSRSIGVLNSSENTQICHANWIVSHGHGTSFDRKNGNGTKNPSEMLRYRNLCAHVEMFKLFDTFLALKFAYVKLQKAHIPYNLEKVKLADIEVVSLLQSLCKIKKGYKEKVLKEADAVSACSALLLAEVQVKERTLEKLKSKAMNQDKQVAKLRTELHQLEMRNKKLTEEIMQREGDIFKSVDDYSFENAVGDARKAIHDFAKPLITLMKLSEWDLDQAANAIQQLVVYAKRSHKKFTFEAYITRKMFHGFSSEQAVLGNVMKFNDPIVALMEDPHSCFAKFCRNKYLLLIHPQMEESFFGNLDHRKFVFNGLHPCTPFYSAFLRMARSVWFLLGFAVFIEPKAEIFGVKHGNQFSDVYMEVVEELKECKALWDEDLEQCKVEFMIMPGFKVGDTLIKSQVYVSKL